MKNLLADTAIAPNGGFQGLGTLGTVTGNGVDTLSSFISSVIGVMTIVAIIWFIFVFLTGAIGIISAGGDKGALEVAKKKISTGLIGLVIVIIAIFIFDLIGFLLGFGTGTLLNLPSLFSTLTG